MPKATQSDNDNDDFPYVHTKTVKYSFSAIPEDFRPDPGAHTRYMVTAEYRGQDSWAVCHGGMVLSKAGEWVAEPRPTDRPDDWLKNHRFNKLSAMRQAYELARDMEKNGVSAATLLKRAKK